VTRPGRQWAIFGLCALAGAAIVSAHGGPHGPLEGLAVVAAAWGTGAAAAAVVLGAAWGLGGWVCRPMHVRGSAGERGVVRFGVGLAVLLIVWLALGTIGFLHPAVAWGLVGIGLARVAMDMRQRGVPRVRTPSPWAWASLAGLCVVFVAASNPPGALWSSEFGAYDVLSYHLTLPQAWLTEGRVWPVEHSAYSYLPGAWNAAYAWVGALTLAPAGDGLLAGGGWRLIVMQHLHASLVVVAAWMTGVVAHRVALLSGIGRAGARTARWIAAGLLALTPWIVVVGSLAYNELGVVVLGAAAIIGALGRWRSAWQRGAVCGVLVGAACLVKPTAIVLVCPVVGLALAATAMRAGGARGATLAVIAGAITGMVTLSPWLVRNTVAADGNPVFPLMTGTLGRAHWSTTQADRWDAAHAAEGGLADRVRTAAWSDPGAGPDAEPVERWRGVSNPQWGIAWFAAFAGTGVAIVLVPRKGAVVAIAAGVGAGLVGWVAVTHIQSRFLVPLAPMAATVAGLGVVSLARVTRGDAGRWVGGALALVQGVWLGAVWAGERGGQPNRLLTVGPRVLMGDVYDADVGRFSTPAWVNNELPADAVVLMIGEASVLYYKPRVVWASAWDQAALLPLGEEERFESAWTGRVRELGVTHLFINLGEVERLRRSGYVDPHVTGEAVVSWADSVGRPVMAWPDAGMAVYRVRSRD
jgi:hypothetical protein